MKILYIAQERLAARLAAHALRGIAPDTSVAWAQAPDAALGWIRDNRDADAVIIDSGEEPSAAAMLVEQIRGLGVDAAIAVLGPEHLSALSATVQANLEAVVGHEQAQHDVVLGRTTRICTALQERLFELEAALHAAGQRHAAQEAASEHLVRREAELSSAIKEAVVLRAAVEFRLAELEAVHRRSQQRAAEELAVADERYASLEASITTRLVERQAQHDASSARSNRICTGLQERLLELEVAIRAASERHARDAATLERLTLRESELGAALADAGAVRTTLEQRLAEALTARQRAAADVALADQRCAAFEEQIGKGTAARAMLEERLAAVERQLHATVAALEQARRDGRSELTAAAARQAALEGQLAASSRDEARLRQEAVGLRRQLDAMRTRADGLRRDAQRVPVLQLQLEESQKEIRRQFERAPYGLFEFAPDGVVSAVNHSLARLLGYRRVSLRQPAEFVAAVFESVTDLRWLLDRARQTGKVEYVETTLRTRHHQRLFVRLHAATKDASVVVAVEDLTSLCAVEHRLREAHRLEAVGRVASEVAATCDTLLRDVSHGGRQWLAGFENDTRRRQEGELLLGDVTRAAAFLRQFVIYGHKQISSLEPVSMERVLLDMKPVLKRVLGDDITLMLPKTMDGFEIDVDSERVERILVNVANCARERMPQGGRMRIQLAKTLVDHPFLASHPKVRPGAHVVLTITETQGPVWPALAMESPAGRAAQPAVPPPAPDKPGMDVGPLVTLISAVGGHFWMSAEPAGNVTLRIHLPQRTKATVTGTLPASLLDRGRQLTRWFRH
jgi:hypothetical protein